MAEKKPAKIILVKPFIDRSWGNNIPRPVKPASPELTLQAADT
jgi:hypothetical protein